jgi:hypothetical protein
MASEASSSSYNNNNGIKISTKRLTKINSNGNDIEMDDRQQLTLNSVGGYVDDLMERIRKMPPKKRSKFYQMLDEERLKDVNNNNHDEGMKSKNVEGENDEHRISMDISMPLVVAEAHSDDDDDRTLIELTPHTETVTLDDDDDDDEDIKDISKQQFIGLNDKNYEELRSMGVPLAVLKAIAFQQHQQAQSHNNNNNNNNNQLANFLTSKCTVSPSNSSSDTKSFLNARTILRRILQQHQKEQKQQHSTNDKTLVEPMDYMTDEEGGIIEDDDDDDDDEHPSSLLAPRHRNGVRSNSHNPVTVTLNPNDISSLSPPTSTSSSPDENDVVNHQSSPNSISRPSSTPAALISSGCSF